MRGKIVIVVVVKGVGDEISQQLQGGNSINGRGVVGDLMWVAE